MGNISYWIAGAVLFGLVAGGLYTWLSPRLSGWMWLFVRSSLMYMAVALCMVFLLAVLS
ncbi:MAG: hypothetical protein K2F86_09520 [Duncaniella sp.]|nr:hypothetical protein [Duncaniella sp.]MDE6179392.1 hypothetical protein [Duncaniella sp.]MDE6390088.1 hypothetical protein [Duncaniella sp.]